MFPYDKGREPGRPKAIPEAIVPEVIALYKRGLGYRAISRELKKENLSVSCSTVRRLIKKILVTNTSCKYTRCSNVAPSHSINKDGHQHGISSCLKKPESTKCTIGPVGLPDIHMSVEKALNQLRQRRTDD